MKRRLVRTLFLPITAAAVMTLAGCGADVGATDAASSPPAATTTTEASPPGSSGPSVTPTTSGVTATGPTCDPGATLVETTEGPYYTEGAPNRDILSDADTVGTPLVVTGTVYDADCQPVPGATIDVWQADGAGQYDNSGYKLRGVLTTDTQGRYTLTTVIPGIYPGRTEHIHVKVNAPGGPVYTTQLFFPGSAANDRDRIYEESMQITVDEDGPDQMLATYNFVLP
jgi:protocatechuate 3,4-dioxygenase beta subunit